MAKAVEQPAALGPILPVGTARRAFTFTKEGTVLNRHCQRIVDVFHGFHVTRAVTLVRGHRIGSGAPILLSHGERFSVRELVDGIRQCADTPTIAQPEVMAAEKPATP
jgi:hypothetical protein